MLFFITIYWDVSIRFFLSVVGIRCFIVEVPEAYPWVYKGLLDEVLRHSAYRIFKVKGVKEAAYKGLVRPVLDYGSWVWDPPPPDVVLQEELESVQKRAARFVTDNYNYETGSMTGILGQLKWESLKKRRKDNRLILLYKGLKGKASVPTDDLIPKTRRCRNQHSMAFQTPMANTDVYKGSFFPQTIRDWNALPDSLISSTEDAEDCVAKFTSLVRARD